MVDSCQDRPIPQIPLEAVRALHDASKRVAYVLALETVERLQKDSQLISYARRWRIRHPLPHPPVQAMWLTLLDGPPDELARALLALDDRGELLRDTKPSFGPVADERLRAIARSASLAGRGPGDPEYGHRPDR